MWVWVFFKTIIFILCSMVLVFSVSDDLINFGFSFSLMIFEIRGVSSPKSGEGITSILSSSTINWFKLRIYMQSSANIVRYCTNDCRNSARISSWCRIHKRRPDMSLTGELWGVFSGYLWENWPRYNGTAVYNARWCKVKTILNTWY